MTLEIVHSSMKRHVLFQISGTVESLLTVLTVVWVRPRVGRCEMTFHVARGDEGLVTHWTAMDGSIVRGRLQQKVSGF